MNQQHPLFPVTLNGTWQSPQTFALDAQLLDWLIDPSSLTARLKMQSSNFCITVLGQQLQVCSEIEASDEILAGEDVLVREVLLCCDDIPQVFARSLLPLRSLTGAEKKLADLGNQSLGQVLFNNPELVRKGIKVASFSANTGVGQLALAYNLPTKNELWGRRSVFMLHEKPLMVAEVFLPGAFAYAQENIL